MFLAYPGRIWGLVHARADTDFSGVTAWVAVFIVLKNIVLCCLSVRPFFYLAGVAFHGKMKPGIWMGVRDFRPVRFARDSATLDSGFWVQSFQTILSYKLSLSHDRSGPDSTRGQYLTGKMNCV